MDFFDSIAHSNVATLVSEARVKISVTVIKLSAIHREDVKLQPALSVSLEIAAIHRVDIHHLDSIASLSVFAVRNIVTT